MITVREVWSLKPRYAARAEAIMQEMDDLVGPAAHEHEGWRGHATFYQNRLRPTELVVTYPWASEESHWTLTSAEEPTLADFSARYCDRPRQIDYYSELAVDVADSHS